MVIRKEKEKGVFIAVVLFGVAAGALPAAAMTEHCMRDGDGRETFFAAPTELLRRRR